jgi:uncharacterized protein
MATILITGGSGLIGGHLSAYLLAEGHTVRHLGRGRSSDGGPISRFRWDIAAQEMDDHALDGVDHIVHLAGAGIADKRWSDARVCELIESRVDSARLLHARVKALGLRPKSFISAAGINYYGAVTSERIFTETDPPANDIIGRISREWEEAVDEWRSTCRVVKLRTPVVLAAEGGALPKLAAPVRLGLGSPLGSGMQWMPWVHIDDLVRAYAFALGNEQVEGAFNVTADDGVTNAEFMRTLAGVLGRPYFAPAVPAFVLELVLGRLSSVLLKGSRASNGRLHRAGFTAMHTDLHTALSDLLKK